jgi:glutamate racemase
MTADSKPIGVFDSGVGGLTVFREIARRLPGENLIYLGDSARVPYGTKSAETVQRYSGEAADFLLGRGIKMLVVACNTATAAALPFLQERLRVPVVGVVDPGAEAAVNATRSGKIGVIATEGTVRSQAYTRAIKVRRKDVEVIEAACPLFVPLVEEGWANTRVAEEVAGVYLEPLVDAGIDTLVLGCTHYPLLKNTIQHVIGDAITIVDSAETTAQRVLQQIGRESSAARGDHLFLVTDAAERFRKIAGEFLEQNVKNLELVSISQ